MNYETVIGLEVHVELKTESKMFSPSAAHFGAEPNTNTNVIDFGYPGVLPKMNRRGIEFAIKAALALNCEINPVQHFDRKNYFYPDNPKAFQTTQLWQPIGENGWIEIEVNGETKKIRIERLHLEEDAGKNIHGAGDSLVDLNRQGTPLLEIVSEADMRSPEEAYAYLEKIREIIRFTGVSDVKMEEGSMRCDANISLRPYGQKEFGTKNELKNLNSFNYVRKGLAYEEKRQAQVLNAGGVIEQATRRYDENTGKTQLMRVKEGAADYRYFPEPDLPPFTVADAWLEEIQATLPEMPADRRKRYVDTYELPEYDAQILTQTLEMSDFFDATVKAGADPKQASNWLMGEVNAYMNDNEKDLDQIGLTPESLAEMIALIEDGTISSKQAKKVFKLLADKGGSAKEVVEAEGLVQLSDPAQLLPLITEILDNNQQSIDDYKAGKKKATGFLVGQIMKATKGQANPQVVNQLLTEELDKR
ncbi:aspartyl-tRNA(Asn)/glutamyl-tRNA(Gln) amidotransferase subunit B [Aerococcus sp. 150760007-1]|uniref:Aspartyl/glutamyl-tRNA(Asn/Gln) amidotransferase subunit B n=1 Tax=Aerococcus urinaeequi TaxID=51665 RepID=A0ABR6A042_9LACT|nr:MULTISPECIES: Asp-tRNA(Asn)/Glu-tRNA(Gln) amidotransferase subunit GatB [Lactobacillales]KAF3298989.1 Asp-tRNA(Asn)/Glu-tRNA(Gln) amidotransferase subunit GatB [Carnobacterium sp. PL17RED31]KAF3300049.1 Asp-tRNA(Asn)/Glu-tRNA(Gln) amidotransferase subunit GatB [Carnobacterium sp. PL12RED10]KAF3305993.1 Asp-tRNA(Asn)/Glu-tRNA(Gln) amidotransferase subunit GatB [Carnobacterium sp. PL17GRE32]MBA5747354.1 Asp-tRNA(Asn)/Glu-tRNA(Gln) amidotransferase subunit GatB [Aerococcus urinaeequi]MBA583013